MKKKGYSSNSFVTTGKAESSDSQEAYGIHTVYVQNVAVQE